MTQDRPTPAGSTGSAPAREGLPGDEDGRPSGMLWALAFREGRAAPPAEPAGAGAEPAPADWIWSHFPLGDVRARACIRQAFDLPAEAVEVLDVHDERIQLHGAGGWAFGILPDLERDLAGKPLGPGRLFFALDSRRLVTARRHALRVVDDVRRACEQGELVESPAAAVWALVDHYLDLLEQRFEALGRKLDTVEDLVLGEPADLGGAKLGPFRREVARHRRELQSLRSALTRSRHGREALQGTSLAEMLSRLVAPVEDLDHDAASLQDRARLLHEEIDTLITSATNRSMRTLTVISTLLIPPTLVVGAFGMNLGGIPFARSPAGFALASMICLALIGGALVLLRRLKLLS